MAQFQYRLQPLLDARKQARKDADRVVAGCRAALREASEVLTGMQHSTELLESNRSGIRNSMLSGDEVTGLDIRRRVDDIAILGRKIEDAKDEMLAQRIAIEECEERLAEAERAAAELSRQVEVLTKHREKVERKFLLDAERREANEQEEIAATMYEARRRG
jgi:flagellar biosynthesis chaperone FliJ